MTYHNEIEESNFESRHTLMVEIISDFIAHWIPYVLQLRKIYPDHIFTHHIQYPSKSGASARPASESSRIPLLKSGPSGSRSLHPFWTDVHVSNYVDSILDDFRRLCSSRKVVGVAICLWQYEHSRLQATAQTPVERHIFNFGDLFGALLSSSLDSALIQEKMFDACKKLWSAYSAHDSLLQPLSETLLTWSFSVRCEDDHISDTSWETSRESLLVSTPHHITPIRTIRIFPQHLELGSLQIDFCLEHFS